ncbi:NHL repeat protein [compost metagenome]
MSDTEIRAWVPDGAQSGSLGLRSNGVASNALDFQVIASLRVIPYYAGLYVGDRQTFEVEALDSRGLRVASPNVRWELDSSLVGTLDAAGSFAGVGEGWSEIRVQSGAVTGLAAVGVTRYQITRLPPPVDHRQIRLAMASEAPDGSVLFSDWQGDRVYRQDAQGNLTRLAGTGERTFSADGTLAFQASLLRPTGVAMDPEGNVYLSESDAHRIRVIPSRDGTLFGREVLAGRLYTLAGTGEPGFNGDGEALARSLYVPRGLLLDRDGSLIFVDSGNRRLRRLTRDGSLVTLAGGGASPYADPEMEPSRYGDYFGPAIARDAVGNLYFHNAASTFATRIFMLCRQEGTYFGKTRRAGFLYALTGAPESGFSGDGPGMQTRVLSPDLLVVAPSGDLLISERGGRIVKRLDPRGHLTTLAGAYFPSTTSIVPPVALPAPATAQLLSIFFLQAAPDGTLTLWDLAATWRLGPVRQDSHHSGN